MLNGATFLLRVRKNLRDVPTAFRKRTFWSSDEIFLALNASQLVLSNLCINTKYKHLLVNLITSRTYTTAPYTLPSDYLHYHSGLIEGQAARVLLCPFNYLNSNMNLIGIWGNVVVFHKGTASANGTLFYYKLPNTIINGNFQESFSDMFYDMIVEHATIVLGMKEIQSQREAKLNRDLVKNLITQPLVFANFNQDVDMNYNKINEQRASQTKQ